MARKQYKEAAKTAIIIANEEQVNGIYLCPYRKCSAAIMDFLLQEIIETLMTFCSVCTKN